MADLQENATLRIGSALWDPYVYPCAMGPAGAPDWNEELCEFPGFTAEILYRAAQVAKIKFEVIPLHYESDNSLWGKLDVETKTYDGMLGLLQNGTVDTLNCGYFTTYERYEFFDFGYPLVHSKTKAGFIFARPVDGMSLKGAGMLYEMFQPRVWAAFGVLAMICLTILMMARVKSLVDGGSRQETSMNAISAECFSTLGDVLNNFVDQYCGRFSEKTIGGGLSMLSVGVLALFFQSMYEGYLVTLMLRNKSPIPFRSTSELADLINTGDYKIITFSLGDYYMDMVDRAGLPAFKKMKESLKKYPPILEPDFNKMLDRIQADPSLVHPGRSGFSMVPSLIDRCNLMFQEDTDVDAGTNIALFFKKGNPLGARIGSALAGMIPFIEFTMMKYYKKQFEGDHCYRGPAIEGATALKLKHYYGPIIIWFIGAGLAITVLVFEWLTFGVSNNFVNTRFIKSNQNTVVVKSNPSIKAQWIH